MSRGHDQRPGQRHAGAHRVPAQLGADLGHRPVQVDGDHVALVFARLDIRQVLRRVGLELLEEHPVGGDLAQRLPVGRARHRDRDRAGRPVPGQPDHPDVVAEVLAAELRADADPPGDAEHLLFQLAVAEAVPRRRALLGQRVQVLGRRVLGGLQRELGAGPADHDGQVIRRARGGAERADLLLEEREHPGRVQHGLGLLVQERLVGRPAALGHEQELVLVPGGGVDLHLRGQVAAGVLLGPTWSAARAGSTAGSAWCRRHRRRARCAPRHARR